MTDKRLIKIAWQQGINQRLAMTSTVCGEILQLLYAIKAIICILLNRYGEIDLDYYVEIAMFDFSLSYGEYGGEEWEVLRVGRGFLKRWVYEIISDGYP